MGGLDNKASSSVMAALAEEKQACKRRNSQLKTHSIFFIPGQRKRTAAMATNRLLQKKVATLLRDKATLLDTIDDLRDKVSDLEAQVAYAGRAAGSSDEGEPILTRNIKKMTPETGFDVLIVCTSTEAQADFWQKRLTATRGEIAPKSCVVCAVFEDWNSGGAGNGLGTLYAFKKAQAKAKAEFGIDLEKGMLDGSFSVGMYHTAGKGTRLAPIPGAENNNKPGVKLPGVVKAGGQTLPLTILEAVIKQTGSYAPSRKGRLSVFWGDQVFVPSVEVDYDGSKYHADILACMGPMPTKEVWEEKGYSSYGLIAMGATGEGAQVEKVDFDTATKLLSGLGEVTSVGPSLGSFSVSAELLTCLSAEYAPELAAKDQVSGLQV
jgi:hypothetical protein